MVLFCLLQVRLMEWLQNPDRRWPPTVDHRCRRQSDPESRDPPVLQSQLPGPPGPLQQLLCWVPGAGNQGFFPLLALRKPETHLLLPSKPEEPTGPLPLLSPCLGRFHPASPVSGSS
ncbi:unnamed protein product [Lepidochelys kempii]